MNRRQFLAGLVSSVSAVALVTAAGLPSLARPEMQGNYLAIMHPGFEDLFLKLYAREVMAEFKKHSLVYGELRKIDGFRFADA